MSLAFFEKDDVAIVGKTASYPSTPTAETSTQAFLPDMR
jgi:hypothetical protein